MKHIRQVNSLTGNLNHFTVTKTGMASSDPKAIIEGTGTRATVVLVGAIDGNDVTIAVENNGAWMPWFRRGSRC